MNSTDEGTSTRACWFVGAADPKLRNQTQQFVEDGVWQCGDGGKYDDQVRSIQVGDRIAIKSTYTRKHGLPFDNRGHSVSVMEIKAVGTVSENLGDGRRLKVDWSPLEEPREWYFFTYRGTVWRVLPGYWTADALIGFAFEEKPQDFDQFRNAAYWRERFGDITLDKPRFEWTSFYEAMADKLLTFRNRRSELISGIHKIASKTGVASYLQDQFEDGSSQPLKDICPFTAMGMFNRGMTDANRIAIASELATFLGVTERVPDSFEGIPLLNNQGSWFFGFARKRKPEDIDTLWEAFNQAIAYADSDDTDARSEFVAAYDKATNCDEVGWKLSMGLYWIRPWSFPTLEKQSREYILNKLNVRIDKNGPKGRCNASDYLRVLDALEARFPEDVYPVHSFPELSLEARHYKDGESTIDSDDVTDDPSEAVILPAEPYAVDDILADGCFIVREKLEKTLACLRAKKNLILQGPPGTGKTWLAKRLAFALIGERDDSKIQAVQFHPNLSYEDFVRGWRPGGDGKLTLVDGPFLKMMAAAEKDPQSRYVFVIEEINRGNPAQIFGELLTLLEVDKRTPNEALQLSYCRFDGEPVFIPDNVYVVGTMNIADRSLALVDLALRRRFAFIDLEPTLGNPWQDWVHTKCGIDYGVLADIEKRVMALNEELSADAALGPQFRIGHSYVTPPSGAPIDDAREWFRQVVDSEIGPLLDEYWFDDLEKSEKARSRLLERF